MQKIGTVLLSKDGYYVGPSGELPTGRPEGDKEFITSLIKNKAVLCSPNTLAGLPKSITREALSFTSDHNTNWTINFGIGTFKEPCDLFIIVHTTENLGGGSKFKFEYIDNLYNRVMCLNNISLYIKNPLGKN